MGQKLRTRFTVIFCWFFHCGCWWFTGWSSRLLVDISIDYLHSHTSTHNNNYRPVPYSPWHPSSYTSLWPSAPFSFEVQVVLFIEAVTVSDCCYFCVIQLKARHGRWARRIKTNYPPFFLLCKEPRIMLHISNFGRIWELTHFSTSNMKTFVFFSSSFCIFYSALLYHC